MNVVYLSYTGLLEPLGQSQVLAYLRILARQHAITLITFEKPEDFADGAAVEALRADCGRAGIRWLPQRYHRRPRLIATLWDLTVFAATALPLIVAIVGIGMKNGAIAADVGTSLIGAGMISVLVLPLLATSIASRESSNRGDADSTSPA